jgi:hypothetical protein
MCSLVEFAEVGVISTEQIAALFRRQSSLLVSFGLVLLLSAPLRALLLGGLVLFFLVARFWQLLCLGSLFSLAKHVGEAELTDPVAVRDLGLSLAQVAGGLEHVLLVEFAEALLLRQLA